MNYIGSKRSLIGDIQKILDDYKVPRQGRALDLFTGTSIVAQFLKRRGYQTYANDWQKYGYFLARATIGINEIPGFSVLESKLGVNSVLRYLNELSGQKGAFYHAYCEGGDAERQYYNCENGLKIQAIRDQIQKWFDNKLVSQDEHDWLVACLLEAADKVANTASVYGAYLKHIKKAAEVNLKMKAIQPASSDKSGLKHKAFSLDAISLLEKEFSRDSLQLIYIDPPYNHRQYSANYHILETIARWDMASYTPRGVTGLRPQTQERSLFCLPKKVYGAFDQLFSLCQTEYLLFSYNNEGLISEEEIRKLLEKRFQILEFRKVVYQRFRADVDHANRQYKSDQTYEFLVLAKSLGRMR